jgi:hypothetical protein
VRCTLLGSPKDKQHEIPTTPRCDGRCEFCGLPGFEGTCVFLPPDCKGVCGGDDCSCHDPYDPYAGEWGWGGGGGKHNKTARPPWTQWTPSTTPLPTQPQTPAPTQGDRDASRYRTPPPGGYVPHGDAGRGSVGCDGLKGSMRNDACGVCGGDGSSCADCAGRELLRNSRGQRPRAAPQGRLA